MNSPFAARTRFPRREILVAVAGVLAASALGWAAWLVGRTPDELADAEVTSTARGVAQRVEEAWEILRAGQAFDDLALESAERFRRAPSSVQAFLEELPDKEQDQLSVAGIWIGEARQKERVGKLVKAQEALTKAREAQPADTDLPGMRLVELRLALHGEDAQMIGASWDQFLEDVPWSVARGGRPLRLLAGWVAAERLDETRREAFFADLRASGADYVLASTDADDVLHRSAAGELEYLPCSSLGATLQLCELTLPRAAQELRGSEAWSQRQARVFARSLAGVAEAGGANWSLHASPLGLAAVRAGELPFLVDERALPDRLRARLLVPEYYDLAFGEGDVRPGEALLDPVQLSAGGPEFVLTHQDKARLAQVGARRRRSTSWSLWSLGLGCLAGAWVTVRALRRERRVTELRSAFVAGVSHDLRTPLASILLLTENLETGRVGPERTQEYVAAIAKEAQRLRRRVEDVLDIARLERGERAPTVREDVGLLALVQELLEQMRALTETAGLRFESSLADLPERANLDPDALRRVLGNLVENALRHSGAKSLGVHFSASAGELLLVVEDDGRGIPARMRERIFAPFERLDASLDPKGGTGLGLAIVRELSEALGGSVSAGPGKNDQGVRFSVRLPLSEPQA